MAVNLKETNGLSENEPIDWEKSIEELRQAGKISQKEAEERRKIIRATDDIWRQVSGDENKYAW